MNAASQPSGPTAAVEARRPVLSVRDARKAYGFVTALAGASLDLHAGEIVALLGDNGAGKSTLIKAVSGIVALDWGISVSTGSRFGYARRPMRARPASRPYSRISRCSTT